MGSKRHSGRAKKPPYSTESHQGAQTHPQEPLLESMEPTRPNLGGGMLAAVKRARFRKWLSAPATADERLLRLFEAAFEVLKSRDAPYEREVILQSLTPMIRNRSLDPQQRRLAARYVSALTPQTTVPQVSGRKPSRLNAAARKLLYADTHARVMKHWVRSRAQRGPGLRLALLKEFLDDGDDGIPRMDQIKSFDPRSVVRPIFSARLRRRAEGLKVPSGRS